MTCRNRNRSTRGTARTRAVTNTRKVVRMVMRRIATKMSIPHPLEHHPTDSPNSHGDSGATQSQTSFASSIPASQLPTQSQSVSQEEDAELANGTAALNLAPEQALTAPRLAEFRAALGREMTSRLFADDSAEVDAVVEAVNRRVVANGGPRFDRAEAVAALTAMDESNNIM